MRSTNEIEYDMPDQTEASTTSIAPLLAVNFVGTLGFSIVTPFLVVLVTNWGGNAVIYGLLAATYSFFQLFGAPILGRWSDRVGRRRVLLLSQLGTLLSWGVFLVAFTVPDAAIFQIESRWLGDFALTFPLLIVFLARAADGLTGGNVSVSNAYLADITSEEDRSKNFGRMAVSSNLGFIFGPALAGLLGATIWGEVLPVAAAFTISAVALAMIRFGLAEVSPVKVTETLEQPTACDLYGQENKPAYEVQRQRKDGARAILALPNMPRLMSVNFLVMLGFSFFYVAFPVHAVTALMWSVPKIGTYFAILSLAMVVVQGPILGRLSKVVADHQLMGVGGAALALGFAALFMTTDVFVYGSLILVAVGNGVMWPTFMATLSKSTDSSLQGSVQGLAQSGGALASIAGLIAGGLMYVSLGPVLFVVAACVIAVSAGLAVSYRGPEVGTATAPR